LLLLRVNGRSILRAFVINKKEGFFMEGYCMKCKEKREIKDAKPVTMKNGKPATEGTCPTCGTKMFKIGAAK